MIYIYLYTLVAHTVSPLLLLPSTPREIWGNIKRGMAQHPQLASPNDPNKDTWSYYNLFQINPIVFDDHLVVILQVPSQVS